jgi:hypothetical protein
VRSTIEGNEATMSTDQMQRLIGRGEEQGCLNMSAISEFAQEQDLSDEEVEALEAELDERGVEVTDDCARSSAEDASTSTATSRPRRRTRSSCS